MESGELVFRRGFLCRVLCRVLCRRAEYEQTASGEYEQSLEVWHYGECKISRRPNSTGPRGPPAPDLELGAVLGSNQTRIVYTPGMASREGARIAALLAREPRGLKAAWGTPTPEQLGRPKLPVEIHREKLWVDDAGVWYAERAETAEQVQSSQLGRPGFGRCRLPLESAAAFARAAIRRARTSRKPAKKQDHPVPCFS